MCAVIQRSDTGIGVLAFVARKTMGPTPATEAGQTFTRVLWLATIRQGPWSSDLVMTLVDTA